MALTLGLMVGLLTKRLETVYGLACIGVTILWVIGTLTDSPVQIGLSLLGLLIGLSLADPDITTVHPVSQTRCSGRVVQTISRDHDQIVRVQCIGFERLVECYRTRTQKQLNTGMRVHLQGRFLAPPAPKNPGDYNALRAALSQDVGHRFIGEIHILEDHQRDDLAQRLRRWATHALDSGNHDYGRRVLRGMLLGDRAAVPPADLEAFRKTGTAHLLAVSGLHVGALSATVWWLITAFFALMKLRRGQLYACTTTLTVIWIFVGVTGHPISAIRAGSMISIYLLSKLIGLRVPPLRALSAIAFFTMIYEPTVIDDLGFQYSFLTVATLLITHKSTSALRSLLGISIMASCAAWPVELWHFGTLSVSAPFANMILTPLASLVLVPLGFLGLCMADISQVPLDIAAKGAMYFCGLADGISDKFGYVWIAGRTLSPMALCMLLCLLPLRLKTILPMLACLLVAFVSDLQPKHYIDSIYVGQGDATLLVSNGEAALIDTGDEYQARKLIGYLKREGIGTLKWVLITHHHPDHYGGLRELSDAIPIGTIFHGHTPHDAKEWTVYANRLRNIEIRRAPQLDELGQLQLTHFHPARNVHWSENDRSISTHIRLQDRTALLTGDLESAGELRLIQMRVPTAEILYLGHHGSRTSTTEALLKHIKPRFAIASCGQNNRYGFPHREVVGRLNSRGIPLLTTATNGRTRLVPNDEAWAIHTVHPSTPMLSSSR